MISYKVLIALIVTYNIICYCCGGVTKMELNECSNILYGVGFSCYSGLVDYCFVKQFLMNAESEYKSLNQNENTQSKGKLLRLLTCADDPRNEIIHASFDKFIEYVKEQYKGETLHQIVREFFMYIAKTKADNKLKTPEEFCTDLSKTQKNNMTEIEKDCVAEILKTEDAEILKTEDEKNNMTEIEKGEILKINDGRTRLLNPMQNIEYGEDKYKNLIKTNILRCEYEDNKNNIIKKLPDYKKKYYEYQINIMEEVKKNNKVFRDHKTWCAETKGFTNPWD